MIVDAGKGGDFCEGRIPRFYAPKSYEMKGEKETGPVNTLGPVT